jgi:hypothetical protein
VITSSIAALNIGLDKAVTGLSTPFPSNLLAPLTSPEIDLAPVPDPHSAFPNPFIGYSASKQIALSETTKFLQTTKPSFDVIHILPAVILGRNELSTSTNDFSSGTNRYVMNIAHGIDAPAPMIGATVYVNDVGLLHVLALDEKVKVGETGVRNFIASSGSVRWRDVNGIVTEGFKPEVENGTLKLHGKMDTRAVRFDTAVTEEVFGIKWVGFEEQVKSVVGHYLEIKEKGEQD